MKKLLLLLSVVMFGQYAMAQQKPTELDKSPLDVSYYPANYPILKMRGQVAGDPSARILYSRPQKKGRSIFGEEVKYNEVWRMGANEATEIEFFKNATVAGKKISKGRYSMFCIPTENKWTIIFNKDNYNWGGFMYRADRDALRVDVPVQRNTEVVEALTMYFENAGNSSMVILWDDLKVAVPVTF
ncbi:DUF2911 domain-containing protein [Aridibaculum aurantiacum]|uniref:DUF2911 domain-containing protein n=1 Tax=Aridibaculum aurantiacum TaxID=2810307 RepID=UPI001A963056|nr:DUF2911 domain-containing protein [Aridibaculum aurantiacum]